jgi:hypothetical protein
MLYPSRSLPGLHDGAADLHSQSPLLRAAHCILPDLPVSDSLRPPSGSMLHDPLCASLRLPPSPRAGLLPATGQLCGPELCRSNMCRAELRRPAQGCDQLRSENGR